MTEQPDPFDRGRRGRATFAPPDGTRARRIDAGSRRALRGCLARAAFLTGCSLLPWLLGVRSLAEAGASLSLAFTLGAILAMLTAAHRGDRAGRGCLNGWDEALAFNGASLLLHMVLRVH